MIYVLKNCKTSFLLVVKKCSGFVANKLLKALEVRLV